MSRTSALTGAVTSIGRSIDSADSSKRDLIGERLNRGSSLGADAAAVLDLVSFNGAEHLRRASRLSTIMRHGGSIFLDCKGSAETYQKSTLVDSIQVFVSHNWSTPRHRKLVALAFYFNFELAHGIAVLVFTLMVVLTLAGWLPTVRSGPESPPTGFICIVVSTPVFLIGMIFGRGRVIARCVGDPLVFLDKTAIHQEDELLQLEGIRKLGAFLNCSERMLVVYTDQYFRKAWTVYEVACFLCCKRTANMNIVPVVMAEFFIGITVFLYVVNVVSLVIYIMTGFKLATPVSLGVGMVPFSYQVRRWARQKAQISENLADFEIQNCTCAVESDRALIYQNVARLLGATKLVTAEVSQEEVFLAFNTMVRHEVPQAVYKSMGPLTMSYRHCISWCFWFAAPKMADYLAGLHYDLPINLALVDVSCWVWMIFTTMPLTLLFTDHVATIALKRAGITEALITVLAAVTANLVGWSTLLAWEWFIKPPALQLNILLVGADAFVVASGIGVYYWFKRKFDDLAPEKGIETNGTDHALSGRAPTRELGTSSFLLQSRVCVEAALNFSHTTAAFREAQLEVRRDRRTPRAERPAEYPEAADTSLIEIDGCDLARAVV